MIIPQPADITAVQLSDLIDDVTADFTATSTVHLAIAEQFFVDVFLPMFAGDEHAPWGATPNMWVNMAKGPFNEVNVVNTQGELLFAVPAMVSQNAIKAIDGTGASARMQTVGNMVEMAKMYANRGPMAVQNVIKSELDKRSFLFADKNISAENIRRWNEIFTRYNRPLLPTIATATASTPSTHAHHIARDSTEFDPL